MINFNLMEYQLDDVRRAIQTYIYRSDSLKNVDGEVARGPAGNVHRCNDRHALSKLANEIINIVLENGVSDGLPR